MCSSGCPACEVPPPRNVQVKLWETLANYSVLDQKLSRKLVHITAGPLLVLTWPLFRWAAGTVQLCHLQGHHARAHMWLMAEHVVPFATAQKLA